MKSTKLLVFKQYLADIVLRFVKLRSSLDSSAHLPTNRNLYLSLKVICSSEDSSNASVSIVSTDAGMLIDLILHS